uniref:Uncharacterized protein n=1 Tax=Physcomitrium patens TaxID=3218 RepID=A0A2K1KKL5_PHYPA|nr:hypothetical protein PHYPA_007997 [Physcomitrium patens]
MKLTLVLPLSRNRPCSQKLSRMRDGVVRDGRWIPCNCIFIHIPKHCRKLRREYTVSAILYLSLLSTIAPTPPCEPCERHVAILAQLQ